MLSRGSPSCLLEHQLKTLHSLMVCLSYSNETRTKAKAKSHALCQLLFVPNISQTLFAMNVAGYEKCLSEFFCDECWINCKNVILFLVWSLQSILCSRNGQMALIPKFLYIFMLISSFVHCRWSKNLKNLLGAQCQHCVGVTTNIVYMWEM